MSRRSDYMKANAYASFASAIRIGKTLSEDIVDWLYSMSALEKVCEDFDEYVSELYKIDCIGCCAWIEKLKVDGQYHIFGSIYDAPELRDFVDEIESHF